MTYSLSVMLYVFLFQVCLFFGVTFSHYVLKHEYSRFRFRCIIVSALLITFIASLIFGGPT